MQGALDNLMDGRTVLVVAHRLSTIRNADNILVFQRGEVIEQGKHTDLVQIEGGYYRELVAKQMVGGAESDQGASSNAGEKSASLDKVELASEVKKGEIKEGVLTEEQKEAAKKGKYVSRSFALNRPELPYTVIGTLGAMMNGSVFPVRLLPTLMLVVCKPACTKTSQCLLVLDCFWVPPPVSVPHI